MPSIPAYPVSNGRKFMYLRTTRVSRIYTVPNSWHEGEVPREILALSLHKG